MVLHSAFALFPALVACEPQVPDPLEAAPWWGGEVVSLEAGLEVAGSWARGWTPDQPVARVWSDEGDRAVLSCAVQVRERPDQRLHLEARAIDLAFRGAAVQAWEDGTKELATWVVEGAASLGSGSPVEIRPEHRAHTASYVHDGRQYAMAILQLADARSIEVVGLESLGADLLAAVGHLQLDRAAPERRIAAALELSQHHAVVNLAGGRALGASSKEGAAQVLEVAAGIVCPLETAYLEGMAQVEALAEAGGSAFARLLSLSDVPARLGWLADELRTSGQAGAQVQVMVGGRPAIFLVTETDRADLASVRDAARSMVDQGGLAYLPEVGLSVSGELVPTRGAAPVATPTLTLGTGWILLQEAAERDPRLAPTLRRVELPASIRTEAEAVRVASAEVAFEQGLLEQLSSGAVGAPDASSGGAGLAPWVVPTDFGWEVDLVPEAGALLSKAQAQLGFSFEVSTPGLDADVAADLRSQLEGLGGALAGTGLGEVELAVQVWEGALESGTDPGEGFIRERPWRRLTLHVSIEVAVGGEVTEVEGACMTPKIYGAAHPREYAGEVIRKGLNDLRGQLGEAIQRALLRPQAVVASGDSELLARLGVLARAFGSRHAPTNTDQITVQWPRGVAGFRACAMALKDTPSGGWLSSLTVRMP